MILDSISPQVLKQLPQPDSISSITIAGASAGLIQVDHLFVFFCGDHLNFVENWQQKMPPVAVLVVMSNL